MGLSGMVLLRFRKMLPELGHNFMENEIELHLISRELRIGGHRDHIHNPRDQGFALLNNVQSSGNEIQYPH
jgi:hypothetical protein